jgi:hypothetical protein
MVPGFARNWIAVNAVQQSSLNKKSTEKDEGVDFIQCLVFTALGHRAS